MVQLIAAAAVGAVVLYSYSAFRKHMDRLEREDEQRKAEKMPRGALEKDPVTGKYRPKSN